MCVAPVIQSTASPPTSRATAGASRAVVPVSERLGAGAVAAGCLGLLVTGACLTPAAAGHGTHEQLGLPPCGWLIATGIPCPTCGMTTAFTHAVHGDLLEAFSVQPAGAAFAVFTAAAFWIALHVAVFGSRLGRIAGKLMRPRWLWATGAAAGASWAYIIATWPGGA